MLEAVFAAVALVTPWMAAGLSATSRGRIGQVARMSSATTGIGFVATAALGISAVLGDSAPVRLAAKALGLKFDALAIVMMLLVLGLSALIQSFAVRYLRGDDRQCWFVTMTNLLTATTALMVGASTVLTFLIAWLAAGASLVLLLATYPQNRQARDGVRRTAVCFAVADLAFIAGAIILFSTNGIALPLAGVGGAVANLSEPLAVVTVLLLIAPGLARSSQIPFHRWLPATLASPTPVSALIHAGVVNAGAILYLRFGPALGRSTIAMSVIFVAGALTVVYASAVRMVKHDVQGRLVFSTMAQMGFMIMACGLGAFAAAIFHLVAHGFYKSALFLSANTGVHRAASQRAFPERLLTSPSQKVIAIIVAICLAIAAVVGFRALLKPHVSAASLALLAFVVLTGGVAIGGTLLAQLSYATVAFTAIGTAAVAAIYMLFVAGFDTMLGDTATPAAVSPWCVIAPGLALVATQALSAATKRTSAGRDLLYSRVLSAASAASE